MFGLGQKLTLENFELWLVKFFWYIFLFWAKMGLYSEILIIIKT